jgi:hypothetical protein
MSRMSSRRDDPRVAFTSGPITGGISTQPPDARLPSQVQDANNVDFTLPYSVNRRPGTKHAAVVSGLTAGQDYRLHAIERDGDERYLIVYGPSATLKVYEILNDTFFPLLLEATVTPTADATTYLNSGSPIGANFSVITVADYTLIANRKVTPAATTSSDYAVSTIKQTWELLTATTPANSTYHRLLEDSSGQIAGYYQYSSGSQTFATFTGAKRSSSAWTSPTGNYDEGGSNPGGFRIGFQRLAMNLATATTALVSGSTYTFTKTGAFTSYTRVAGDMIYITSGTGITAGWATVDSRNSNDQITITARGSCVLAAAVNVASDGIGIEYDVQVNMDKDAGLTKATMEEVAKEFQDGLRDAGCETGLIAWEVIDAGGRMVITSPYKGVDSAIKSITAPGSGLYDYTQAGSPFVFASGTATAGTGSGASTTSSIDSRWTRVVAPNQTKAVLTPTTMPIKLVRTGFTGNGTTPATFSCDVNTWKSRLSGDQDTNPLIPLIDKGIKIQDILFHQDRLVLSGGEYVCFSQTGDLFNFWVDNAVNITDADPITFPLSTSSVVSIQNVMSFRKNILVFTFAGPHFELSADGPFTPSNVVSTASVHHQAWPVRPCETDGRVYYVSERGTYASVMEYFYDDLQVNNTAADVTSHAAILVPLNIKTMTAVRLENAIIILPLDTSYDHKLYVYRSFWTGNRKEQSAWTVYTFDTSYRIVDIAAIRNRVYMLVETSAGYSIEYFSYELDPVAGAESTGEYIPFLDRQHRLTGVFSSPNTTFTLPQSDTTINTLIPTFTGGAATYQTPVTVVSTGTSIVVSGNYSGGTCILGRSYESSLELSRFYIRDDQGRPTVAIEGTIRDMHIRHRRSGPYTFTIDFGLADPRSNVSQSFTPPSGFVDPVGVFKPWMVVSTVNTRFTISTSSSFPMNITAVEGIVTTNSTLR